MSDWTEKYRPQTLREVRGNDSARDSLREWAETWPEHRDPAIVHGSPGVGKTSTAHALANDLGWSTIELNASDQRTATIIERVAGEASKTGTLTEGTDGRRLIILDEADNFHGNADYGGSRAVTDLLKEANQPVVLIANEFYEMSRSLRNACREIEFRDISPRSIVPVLRDICRKEDIQFDEEALRAIAERTSGDLRSAINDLQAIAEGREAITADHVVTDDRDRTQGIFEFLDDVLKDLSPEAALRASYDVDETPDDMIRWIEDNLPKDYEGEELVDAYRALGRADRWLGRVRATQEYRYWRYATDNMTAGVAASRRGSKGGWTRYGPPSTWTKLGRTSATRSKRDHIARRIAETGGLSMETARRSVLPFLAGMTHHCSNRELTISVAARYDLDAAELSFLTGSGEDTNKVATIIEEADRRRTGGSLTDRSTEDESAQPSPSGETDGESSGSASTDSSSDSADEDPESGDIATDGSAAENGDIEETEADEDGDDGAESDSQSGLSDFL